jgi:phosphoglycerate dehydrogenase-like enzyme
MKICVTGPLSFSEAQIERLKAFGETFFHSSLPETDDELIARLKDCQVAIVSWCPINAHVLTQSPALKFISLTAAGFDHIDVDTAKRLGISVATAKGAGAVAVAEFAVTLALNLNRRVSEAERHMRLGMRSLGKFQGHDLSSRVVGVLGAGAIASHVIRIFTALGSQVICHTQNPSPERAKRLGTEFVGLDSLIRQSDIISIHAPLNSQTDGVLGRERLQSTKPGALIVNTARGRIIDVTALIVLIRSGHWGGAALDVFEHEPPDIPPDWFEIPNLILTPHTAFNTAEAKAEKIAMCIENVESFLRGDPKNLV